MKYKLGRCNLPELLKEVGWSKPKLAAAMGWDRQYTSKVCSGEKKLGAALLFSVADTLGVSERRIYDLVEIPVKSVDSSQTKRSDR